VISTEPPTMPLAAQSPIYLHYMQNISLILIAAAFIPLCTAITSICIVLSACSNHPNSLQNGEAQSSFKQQRILVTGVGMTKGLFIARAFYQEGHMVVGADFQPHGIPVCGRFSRAFERFYTLAKPSPTEGSLEYTKNLIDIIQKEKITLWISCSGVMSAIEDGEAAEEVEKRTRCKAIQFGANITKTLHEKHSFMKNTQNLGLNTPETHLIESVEDAMTLLYPNTSKKNPIDGTMLQT
jgi:hypothetical protein